MKLSVDVNEAGFTFSFGGTWVAVQGVIKVVVTTMLAGAAAYQVLMQVPVLVQWFGS